MNERQAAIAGVAIAVFIVMMVVATVGTFYVVFTDAPRARNFRRPPVITLPARMPLAPPQHL